MRDGPGAWSTHPHAYDRLDPSSNADTDRDPTSFAHTHVDSYPRGNSDRYLARGVANSTCTYRGTHVSLRHHRGRRYTEPHTDGNFRALRYADNDPCPVSNIHSNANPYRCANP